MTPKTFIRWHREGFELYWRRKCPTGRPRIPLELQQLICRMAGENPAWGEERIANELLLKLGRRIIQGCEAMHMVRKGQVRWVPGSDVRRQIQFIETLFELHA